MFGFLKNKQPILTDEEIRLRARAVKFALFVNSAEIVNEISKNVGDLNEMRESTANQIFSIIIHMNLYQAQRFFWENVIKEEEQARKFENTLYKQVQGETGNDPRAFIKENIAAYIQRIGDRGEAQYVGSAVCKLLSKEDAFLMMEINTVYLSYLKNIFFGSLKKSWELPMDEIQKMIDANEI